MPSITPPSVPVLPIPALQWIHIKFFLSISLRQIYRIYSNLFILLSTGFFKSDHPIHWITSYLHECGSATYFRWVLTSRTCSQCTLYRFCRPKCWIFWASRPRKWHGFLNQASTVRIDGLGVGHRRSRAWWRQWHSWSRRPTRSCHSSWPGLD